jgi:hypothetical protein
MTSQHVLAGGKVSGNREVSRPVILVVRGDLSGARNVAIPKEGGSWGKHGFPHGSEATRDEMLRALREAEVRERERRGAPAAV